AWGGAGFSNRSSARPRLAVCGNDVYPPITAGLGARSLDDGYNVTADIFIGVDHLLEARRVAHHQIIDQQNSKRLITDKVSGAPYRVAEAERPLLPGIRDLPGGRQPRPHFGQPVGLAAFPPGCLQLETRIQISL